MKKYMIFKFMRFYPDGGFRDLKEFSDESIKDIKKKLEENADDTEDIFIQIVEISNLEIISEGKCEYGFGENRRSWEWKDRE